LRLVRGVGLRTLQFLEEGGYRAVRDVVREDPDRLSIRSGLTNRKARLVQAAAKEFLETEAKDIEVARSQLAARPPESAAAEATGAAQTDGGG
jgi:N utilization substance protein A